MAAYGIDLRPNFGDPSAFDAEDVDARPCGDAARWRYLAQLPMLCSGCGVALDHEVVLRDELIEGVNEDAFR